MLQPTMVDYNKKLKTMTTYIIPPQKKSSSRRHDNPKGNDTACESNEGEVRMSLDGLMMSGWLPKSAAPSIASLPPCARGASDQ